MVETGVFRRDDPVELVDGRIWDRVTPQSRKHALVVHLVAEALGTHLVDDSYVMTQCPLALGADSMPEPDVAVIAGSPRDHVAEHPSTARLVVEVAGSSLSFDRTIKSDLYARERIPAYWIVDLAAETIEIRREPARGEYRHRTLVCRGDVVAPDAPGTDVLTRPVDVAAMLP